MLLRALPLFVLAAAPAGAADLFVGPGAPFAEIQPAIDAALPGDTIHVAPGQYDVFVLGKPLALLGAGSGAVLVRDPDGAQGCVVSGNPAGSETVLAGFEIGGPAEPSLSFSNPDRLRISNCWGRVTLHDLRSAMVAPQSYSPRILSINNCRQVIVSRSQLLGTGAGPGGQIPLHATDSDVWVVGCELRGGDGPLGTSSPNPFGFAFTGSPALRLWNSTARVSRSSIVGGRGGARFLFPDVYWPEQGGQALLTSFSTCTVAGGPANLLRGGDSPPAAPAGFSYFAPTMGGSAIGVDGTVPFGFMQPSTVVAAADAVLQGGLNLQGVPGTLIDAPVIDLAFEPLERPTLQAAHVHPAWGTTTALELAGPAGSLQFVHAALASADALELPFGELLLPLSAWPLASTALDAAGLASMPLAIPANPALAGTPVWFQSAGLAGAELALSAPACLVIGP